MPASTIGTSPSLSIIRVSIVGAGRSGLWRPKTGAGSCECAQVAVLRNEQNALTDDLAARFAALEREQPDRCVPMGVSLAAATGRRASTLAVKPMVVDRAWVLGELRKCLHALSLDGDRALSCAPPGSCRADELALDYDNFLSAAMGSFEKEFTPDQVAALRRVDELLSAMSGHSHEDLWTDEAVRSHPRWQEVRSEARQAVEVLGWQE